MWRACELLSYILLLSSKPVNQNKLFVLKAASCLAFCYSHERAKTGQSGSREEAGRGLPAFSFSSSVSPGLGMMLSHSAWFFSLNPLCKPTQKCASPISQLILYCVKQTISCFSSVPVFWMGSCRLGNCQSVHSSPSPSSMYTAFICIWGLTKLVFVNLTQDTVVWEEGI